MREGAVGGDGATLGVDIIVGGRKLVQEVEGLETEDELAAEEWLAYGGLIIRLFQNTLTSMTNTAIGLFSICAPKTEWDQMSCLSGRLNTMMSKRYHATASKKTKPPFGGLCFGISYPSGINFAANI